MLAIILIALLAVGGAVYFSVIKKPSDKGVSEAEKSLEELKVETPGLDFSLSPLPKLEVSSLNLSLPQLPSLNIFPGFSVSTDFTYDKELNISAPSVDTSALNAISAPSQQQGPAINAATCAMFSAIPSSQFCSMTGSGQTLCVQCKAAGF